jgi:hypothetical protein
VIVCGAAFMIHCMFGSTLNSEWAFWIVALLVKYSELYARGETAAAREPLPQAA